MTRKWQLSEFLPIFKDGMLGGVNTSSDFDQLSESNQLLSSHMWTMLHETFLEIEKNKHIEEKSIQGERFLERFSGLKNCVLINATIFDN